ncbi:MAG: MFS transporter [Clostridia bacterium]|nr:MFS transporter [Clostridia bacterium]
MRKNGSNGYPWRYAWFFMAYYAANSIYQNYITVYFDSTGQTTAQIGMLMGAVPIMSMLAQPFFGNLGDRSKSRSRLLLILCVLSATALFCMRLSGDFYWLMIMICLFAATFITIQPLNDSIVLEALSERRMPFGPLRMMGSVAFAIAAVVVGGFLDSRVELAPVIAGGVILLAALCTLALPKAPGHMTNDNKTSMLSILKIKGLVPLLTLESLLQLTLGFFYSFFSIHFLTLPGANSSLLGIAYIISALSEIPYLIFADRLFDKYGAGKMMLLSGVVLTIRWTVLASVSNVAVVMSSQLLHCLAFAVLTVSMGKHINKVVPDELKARGQMLLTIISFGVPRVIGNIGGGALAQVIGIQPSFYYMAALAFITLICFAPMYLKKRAT